MNRTVGKVLGRHVVEVVGALEIPPVLLEAAVLTQAHALAGAIQFIKSFVLQGVAYPSRGIAGLVGTRDGVYYGKFAHGFELGYGLGWSPELNTALIGKAWQSLKELKDAARCWLQRAECLEIEADIDDLLLGRCGCDPVHILVGGEGEGIPRGVGEAECDVVGELVVLEQKLEFGHRGCRVYIVGRLPAEDVLGALGDAALEAHCENLRSDIVGIDKLGIAEHLGFHPEEFVQLVALHLHLLAEFFRIIERCQRVSVWCGNKLYLACVGKLVQQIDELGHVLLELLDGDTCDRDRAAECALGVVDHAQQCLCCGDIALMGYAGHDVVVEEVIVVVVVVTDVEETIALETERLMYLEVKTYGFHIVIF